MLIDRTLELSQASNYSYIEIYFDVVIHYEVDAPSSPDPSSINYYSSSLFYGIKSF